MNSGVCCNFNPNVYILVRLSIAMVNDNSERNRLCDLLDEKRDELIMRFPGSWMHRHVLGEIAEIRSWLYVAPSNPAAPRLRFLVKRRN